MKKIKPDGSKTLYIGGIYEVDKTSGGTVTGTKTYYPAAGAMRIGSTLYFILKSGDQPIAGDWNNDGIDTIGVFRTGMFYLRNANSTGNADLTFGFGTSGDLPIAGNWDALPPPPPPPTATPTSTPPSPSAASASFVYDGDGKRVKSVINGTTTTYFVGAHYEVTNGVVTKYYYAGSQRIAMRTNGIVNYLLGDHLGSTSLTTDATGTVISELRYKAWGEVRYASGNAPTKYTYTGQYSYTTDFGLMYYGARWYDPYLNHFTQPDTIVPNPYNPQDWDRYSYARNNPLRYTDPSGHKVCDGAGTNAACDQSGIPDSFGKVIVALRSYGVKLNTKGSATWTFGDAYSAYVGVNALGSALARIAGQDATTIFKQAFGPMTFTIRNDIGYFGIASDGNIDFRAGRVTARLTVHELGHSFEMHMKANNGGVYADDHPLVMLIRQGIYDANDNLVTGKGLSNRYNGLFAPNNGYACDSYIGQCQYHSRDVDEWNNEDEDWADIFMNWTYDSFAHNPAGDALYNWVETNMVSWLR